MNSKVEGNVLLFFKAIDFYRCLIPSLHAFWFDGT